MGGSTVIWTRTAILKKTVIDAQDGDALVTSIDANIQSIVEEKSKTGMKNTGTTIIKEPEVSIRQRLS